MDFKNISADDLTTLIEQKIDAHAKDPILTKEQMAKLYEGDHCRSNDLETQSLAMDHQEKIFQAVMKDLGFARTSEKFFEREDCPLIIQFYPPPLALGREPLKKLIYFSVKDRLAGYYKD